MLKKVEHKRTCIGFAVPKFTDEERDIAKNILAVLSQHGFANADLDKKLTDIEKVEQKDEKNQNIQ